MKITKDFKGLINEGYRYKFEGPIAKVKNGKVVIHD
jgi:hypothetical protein